MFPLQRCISLAFLLILCVHHSTSESRISDILFNNSKETVLKDPSVLIAVIARNSEHLLPNWLGYIENLDYPKKRISIWIATDHNEDNTSSILREWVANVKPLYHRVLINVTASPTKYKDASFTSEWTDSRYLLISQTRQRALEAARKQWADYLFVIDCDIFMTNPKVLQELMAQEKTVVAPMIEVFGNQSGYSNYWGGIDSDGYYMRTDDYFPVLNREVTGCFEFPMVHSTYLVDLRRNITNNLVYYPPPPEYRGEIDDILIFAYSARFSGIKMHLINKEIYGYMMPPYDSHENLTDMKAQFVNDKLDYFVDYPETLMPVSPHVTVKPKKQDKLVFDEIYMINLKRRPLRRRRMLASLAELGIKVKVVDAVDGEALTSQQVKEMGIKMLPGYADPYSKRPLTMGEIGCFLSHYLIWEEMLNNGLKYVLVLEDDVRFQPDFRQKLAEFLEDAEKIKSTYKWDLIYLGRKPFLNDTSELLTNRSRIAWADYSYWTLAYMLSLAGARKLISARPLQRLLPVDEFLPIMYNRHSIYIGRRRMKTELVSTVEGAKYINWVNYTWWTLGYIINLQGARKLISAKPLTKMMAVDEFLPVMYDRHPNKEWAGHFEPRNLVAMTAEPLLLFPTHYIGDEGYFSDTETAAFVPDDIQVNKDEL